MTKKCTKKKEVVMESPMPPSLNISPRGPRDSTIDDILNMRDKIQVPKISLTVDDESVEGDQLLIMICLTLSLLKLKPRRKGKKKMKAK